MNNEILLPDVTFPENWKQGWKEDLRIGCNETEIPFKKNGKWYLYVWEVSTNKHYYYDFNADTCIADTEFNF